MTIFSSLRGSFLVGTSLAALVAFPSAAAAQDECGPVPPGGGTVTCPTADYPDGIDYQPIVDLTLVLSPDLTTGDGVSVTSALMDVDLRLDAQGGTLIRSSQDGLPNGAGVTILSAQGSVFANVDAVETSGTDAPGINAGSRDGTTVRADQVTTTGDGATGINAYTLSLSGPPAGVVHIESGSVETAGDFATGIFAGSLGDASVLSGEVNTLGETSTGIFVQSEGNAQVHSTSVTTQGDTAAGIYAAAYGGGEVVVVSGAVATAGQGSIGLDAHAGGGTGDGDIAITSSGVGTEGNYAIGVQAIAQYGAITISSGTVTTAGHDAAGVYASQSGEHDLSPDSPGTISITSASVATGGEYSPGISAGNTDGDIAINSGTITTAGDAAHGIVVNSRYGDVTIASNAIEIAGERANGIATFALHGNTIVASETVTTRGEGSTGLFLTTADGTIALDSGRVETFGERSDGIGAFATDEGAVSIASDMAITHGDHSNGIVANSVLSGGLFAPSPAPVVAPADAGHTTVVSAAVRTEGENSGGIVATGTKVQVTSGTVATLGDYSNGLAAYATADATVSSGSVQTAGLHSVGILAEVNDGAATVTSEVVVTTGEASSAIVATQAHPSPLGNRLAADEPAPAGRVGSYPVPAIAVTSGTIRTSAGGSDGIVARSEGGPVSIISGSIQTAGIDSQGIIAVSAGRLTIQSGTIITQGDGSTAISANQTVGTGGIGIASGSIAVGGRSAYGIYANTVGGSGAIDIASTGTITASGLFGAGVIALSNTGAITIASNSILASGNASFGINAVSVNGQVSIDATNVRATGAQSDAIVVNGGLGSSLLIRGLVEATDGISIQANGGASTIATTASGIIRGRIDLTDNADTVNNAGTFDAIGSSAFGTGNDLFNNSGSARSVNGAAVFTGLETFNNAGQVDLRDNAVGDSLNVGGAFVGSTSNSRLGVDANLGINQADVLVTGAATGTTMIDVHAVGGLALNTTGTLVVDASAGTSATAFTLAGGIPTNPFVALSLRFDAPTNDFLLVGDPNAPVFEQVGQAEMATNFWYGGADAVTAQLEAARDGLISVGTVQSNLTGDGRLGGWVQGVAGNVDRKASNMFGGTVFDTGFEQDYQGVQGGLDFQSGGTILGVTFGYAKSDAEFGTTFNRVEIEGYNLGAYAALQSGGFFVNAIAKIDWMDADSTPGAGLRAQYDATAWGLRGTAGYRFNTGNLFIEPSLSLSFVHADIDDCSVGGATIAFDDIESFRGSLGVRLGGDFRQANGSTWSPFIGVHAIDEFSGDAAANFTLGQTIALRQDSPGTYGELHGGVNYATGRLEVFARGEYDFGRARDGLSGRAGLRLRF